jgi:membrane protease YdiL (CAAX protease family)
MFRALVITLMLCFWKNLFEKDSRLTISVILSSTLIFMFDHINFSVSPFTVTHFDILQQLTAMIFGIFYGYLFTKTRSVAGPMLAHNLLNGVIVVIGLALFLTLG